MATPTERIEAYRRIVERHQYETIDGTMIDATTANLLCVVHDGLSEQNRAHLLSFPAGKAGTIAWKLVDRGAVRVG